MRASLIAAVTAMGLLASTSMVFAQGDTCATADPIAIGGTAFGNTTGFAPETLGACGTSDGTGGAVWYSVIGDGTMLTASTCNPGTDFDTKLRVWTGTCAALVCVGGNDDTTAPECVIPATGFNRKSRVTWCSNAGVGYFILVHGFSSTQGNYELSVTSDLVTCEGIGACCLNGGGCTAVTGGQAECDTIGSGGTYQGDGSDCATVVCPGTGACCVFGVGCFAVINGQAECDTISGGGTYQGDGTDCAMVDCPGVGACCVFGVDCFDVIGGQAECDTIDIGGTYQGDGTDCATTTCPSPCPCGTVINAYPYVEDFEAQATCGTSCGNACVLLPGGWANVADEPLQTRDWTIDVGGTPSSGTGPSVDHTLGTSTGKYAYTEASSPCDLGDVYYLQSPCLDISTLSNPVFGFAYHMFGADQGTLEVQGSTDLCENFSTLFTVSGLNVNAWNEEVVDLSPFAGATQLRIRIVGTTGGGFASDMAIDDLVVRNSGTGACCFDGGACSTLDEGTCTASGGEFQGAGTDCVSTNCIEACCFEVGGSCSDLPPADCTSMGGFPQGLGSDCASTACFEFPITTAGPVTTCLGTFTDSGGSTGNYQNNEDITLTFFPSVATDKLRFNFTSFTVESGFDQLDVHEGNSIAAPLIGSFDTSMPPGIIVSNALDGSLTFHFTSDGSVAQAGWIADISCITPGGPEACCFSDGTCADLTAVDCSTAGGLAQGVGTDCATALCPPPNDDCDGAIAIGNGTTPVDLTGATSSGLQACNDFPVAPVNDISNDLFYSYTATCTGTLFVDTCGDADDTRLAVYDARCADILAGVPPIECNDDHGSATEGDTGMPCPNGLSASLSVQVVAGNEYIIRVGSFSEDPVTFMFPLNVSCPGDLCGTCPGDVNGDGNVDGLDVPNFTSCYLSDFGTTPSTGCGCADTIDDDVIDMLDLDEMVNLLLTGPGSCNPGACCFDVGGGAADCVVTSSVGCDALGGIFTLGGDCTGDPCPLGRCCSAGGNQCDDVPEVVCSGLAGDWDGGLTCAGNPCPIIPQGETCATAEVINAVPFIQSPDFGVASSDGPGGTCDAFAPVTTMSNDVWWQFTASQDCTLQVTASSDGSDIFDPIIVIRDNCTALTELVCVDDNGDNMTETATLPLTSGQTVLIQIGDNGGAEDGTPGTVTVDCQ